ncbi:MAG: penicillin-binding protein activator [Gammaproteobacteria bacterium]|nr:penicillin-binding protein activator [Gammaproteobacteria bacterium]
MPEQAAPATPASPIDALLLLAHSSPSPDAEDYLLDAVDLLMDADRLDEADSALSELRAVDTLPLSLQIRYAFARASLALAEQDPTVALQILNSSPLEPLSNLPEEQQLTLHQLRIDALFQDHQYLTAVRERIQLSSQLEGDPLHANNNAIWEVLSSAPAGTLSIAGNNVDSYELRGWLELLRLVSSNQYNLQTQMSAIDQWRNTWTQHPASARLPDGLSIIYDLWEQRPREIALVLPMQEPLGKAISEGFLSAYYDAISKGHDVPQVRIYDTSFRTDVLALYDQAVQDGVDMIIGPLLKDAVRRMQRSSSPMPVPTLALNYGDLGGGTPVGLFQFGLAPEDEIMQAADTAWKEGHRNAAVLTPTGEDYLRIQDTFINYWTALGGRIVSVDTFGGENEYSPMIKRLFNIDASEARAASIRNLIPRSTVQFVPRRRQDVDFIFLLANPTEGRQIKPTLSFHFAGDVPVYAMPSIYDGGSSPIANRDLNGIVFNDAPWILEDSDPLKQSALATWTAASGPIQRLRAMGVDSFRLHLRLEQLRQFPYTRISGATGQLTIKPDGGIRRELSNAVIVNGAASVLPR